jgi:hypothetical protein
MREIPNSYYREGFTYTLLKRDGNVAIYEQRRTYDTPDKDFVRYETVIIRKHTKDNDFVGTKAGDEYLPNPAAWGSYGWTYITFEQACEKMSKIILEMSEKT